MKQCKYGTSCEYNIFKSKPNINKHTDCCYYYRKYGITLHLTWYWSTDTLYLDIFLFNTVFLRKLVCNISSLFFCKLNSLYIKFIRTWNLWNYYIVWVAVLCKDRLNLFLKTWINLCIFAKWYVICCTTEEVKTII